MKKKFFLSLAVLFSLNLMAQADKDSVFHVYAYNEEYKVYLDLNLYDSDVEVLGQEVFGKVPGYFGAIRDSRKWLITSAKLDGKHIAHLDIVNDYGSEDLEATLTYNRKDGSYILKQNSGSRLKIVVNRKWVKIPTTLTFVRHERMRDEW